jgi:hypothetical protein
MTPTWGVISLSSMGCSSAISKVYEVEYLFFRLHKLLLKTLYLNLLILILKNLKLLMIINQVIDFAPIDFVHRDSNCKVSFVFLEISNTPIEEISDGQFLQPVHSECFTRASLTIGKYCDYSSIKHQI